MVRRSEGRVGMGENVLLQVITVAIKQAPPKVDFLPQPLNITWHWYTGSRLRYEATTHALPLARRLMPESQCRQL